MDNFELTWSQVEHGCLKIAKTVKDKKIDVIVPIVRGGLVPSVIISELIGVNAILPIRLSTRHSKAVAWYDKDKWIELLNTNLNILLLDDIVDTGLTINKLMSCETHAESPSSVTIASLVVNDTANAVSFVLNEVVHAYTVHKDEEGLPWVVFPWDAKIEKDEVYSKAAYEDAVLEDLRRSWSLKENHGYNIGGGF